MVDPWCFTQKSNESSLFQCSKHSATKSKLNYVNSEELTSAETRMAAISLTQPYKNNIWKTSFDNAFHSGVLMTCPATLTIPMSHCVQKTCTMSLFFTLASLFLVTDAKSGLTEGQWQQWITLEGFTTSQGAAETCFHFMVTWSN